VQDEQSIHIVIARMRFSKFITLYDQSPLNCLTYPVTSQSHVLVLISVVQHKLQKGFEWLIQICTVHPPEVRITHVLNELCFISVQDLQ
jgi:hypothetical protein